MTAETRPIDCCGKCPPIKGGGFDCTCRHVARCPVTQNPLPEASSATCDDCHWSASGPWSHHAAAEHENQVGHDARVHGPAPTMGADDTRREVIGRVTRDDAPALRAAAAAIGARSAFGRILRIAARTAEETGGAVLLAADPVDGDQHPPGARG